MTRDRQDDAVTQRLLKLEQRSRRLTLAVGATAVLLLITIVIVVEESGALAIDVDQVLRNLITTCDSVGYARLPGYFSEDGKVAGDSVSWRFRQLRTSN